MSYQLKFFFNTHQLFKSLPRRLLSNEGSIVAAGGTFAKRERAEEELYFYKLHKQRIEDLREILSREETLFKTLYCDKNDYPCVRSVYEKE